VAIVAGNDPLKLISQTDTVTINGQVFTAAYSAAASTLTQTGPNGQQTVTTFDGKGRPTRVERGTDRDAVAVTYDAKGRVARMEEGDQSWTFEYDARNRVVSRTDAAGHQVRYGYDDADRVSRLELPSGRAYQFGYDGLGHRTRIVMPDGSVHQLEYDGNSLVGYTPPGNAPYAWEYNHDEALAQLTLPDGRTEVYQRDASGRITGLSYAEAEVAVSYAADRVLRVTRTPTGGAAERLDYSYDGDVLTGVTMSGVAGGTFGYRYDAEQLLTGIDLTSGADAVSIALTRDAAGHVTGYGPFTLTRGGPGGSPSRITDGTLDLTLGFDRLDRLQRRTEVVAGQQAYDLQLTYDNVGRITHRVEAVAGVSHTFDYDYDADGRLTLVTRDGAAVERYAYDANGNRSSRQLGSTPAEAASSDAQDRVLQQGALSYAFNADGQMTRRGADTFGYSTRGELLEATAGGQTVRYAYDGLGRRVARTDATGTTQYLYGNPDQPFQVTAARGPSGPLTVFYYDEAGVLFALERGGARYYVGADQVGTPRVVSDAAGNAVKVLEYDSFGNLQSDSNPGFELPIGFAGGLADPATGLVRFGLRDYDPVSGRWAARDAALFAGGQANLYAYAGNDPVGLVDRSGLAVSVGGSLYEGIGAGAKLTIGLDGRLSFCTEVGLGIGGGVSLDPFADLDPEQVSTVAGVEVKSGIVSAGIELELDPCSLTHQEEVCVAIFCVKQEGEVGQDGTELGGELNHLEDLADGIRNLFKSAGAKIEGRVATKSCVQVNW
jgi:RHS repeat-associated protein